MHPWLRVLAMPTTISQIQADVYRDFIDFEDNEVLKYGVLYLESSTQLQSISKNRDEFPRMESVYLNLSGHGEANNGDKGCSASVSQNLTELLMHQRVYVELKDEHLRWFASCITNITQEKIQTYGLRVVTSSEAEPKFAMLQSLQSFGVKIGFTISSEKYITFTQDFLIRSLKANMTIDVFAISFDIKDALYYDYNTYSEYLNRQYARLVSATPGFNPDLIIKFNWRGDNTPHLNTYKSLISKFIYRWGEAEKHFVVVEETTCGRSDTVSCIKRRIFKDHVSQSFVFNLFSFGGDGWKLGYERQTPFSCIDFRSYFLDIFFDNFTEIMELADKHFHSSCNITWHIMWSVEYAIDDLEPPGLNEFLEIKRKYPTLIKGVYVGVLPEENWTDERNNFYLILIRKTISFSNLISGALNMSVTMVEVANVIGTESSVPKNVDVAGNYNEYFNSSIGVYLSLRHENTITSTFLNSITMRMTQLRRSPVFIGYLWNSHKKEDYGSCFKFKRDWTMLKNWADVNSFQVFVAPFSHDFTSKSSAFIRPWEKDTNLLEQNLESANATKEELKFLSNFQDTCVKMPSVAPGKPINFSLALSGVTFVLTEEYIKLRVNDIVTLFKLIHFKFLNIELVVKDLYTITLLNQAISLFISELDSNTSATHRYYLNIDSLNNMQKLQKMSLDALDKFHGIHVNLCQCESDLVTLQRLQKSLPGKVGISLSYDQASKFLKDKEWRKIAHQIQYCVIRLNLATVLLLGSHSASNIDLNKTFYMNLEYGNQPLPNPVFDILRAYRFNFKRLNPNVTVYIQLAWPTTENRKSKERAQKLWGFLDDFSKVFDFPFFLYQAFDDIASGSSLKYGWWKLENTLDLRNPTSYIDKQAEFYHMETQRPNIVFKSPLETAVPVWEIAAGVVILFLLLICTGSVVIYRLRQKLKSTVLTKQDVQQFEMGTLGSAPMNQTGYNDYCRIAYNKERYEIEKPTLDIESSTLIGSGHFGYVYKATIPTYDKPVAVKVPKIIGKPELLSVLREIKVMSFVGEHLNLVKLVGACTKEIRKGIVYVVTEYHENGSLLKHLRERRKTGGFDDTTSNLELYQFCLEISTGMHFLAQKKVIHGDLSTRNVLLDENNVCKICDFGLSRKLYDMDLYVKSSPERVPWKWMAIETLERSEISLKSDIWSLGVTFWEIFSFGEEPYQSVSWDLEFSKKLITGLRLPKPVIADEAVYEKILSCWEIIPDKRPAADEFVRFFQSLKNSAYVTI